ncbi:fumarylacetoacetate hydrolase family protein [Amycolatopsis thermophila]|uniref:2-dehydro-3-deoxy-D-arabinonate dehydratase n=1 Tax=Amycolatopsis thermophila TaxID=206084 RepID=A0ABU0EZW6_9PSEU|nr:fumarylacetoacetate hydrolase family protein [Amycolatopsis thermophila]MDQ0380678.1 2-dehydro-3-deoxy-D-arabinonate dehydratase [Amycolatopsis thermophila]
MRTEAGVVPFDGVDGIAGLLALRAGELRALVTETAGREPAGDVRLLAPVDGRMEVWAAGVTYRRSREARMEESSERSVYEKVYDAARPELFFKAVPWRVVTDGEPVTVRADSPLNVPEPELGLVVNRHAEIVGYTVVDDVSSRSIEGENPLYLPQAKVYAGSCAMAPGIRPVWEVADPLALEITMTVRRGTETAFAGAVSTSALHRGLDDLVRYLFLGQSYPDGAVLATGTGIVPEMDFTLRPGDVVEIAISEVGRLVTPVE